MLTKKIGPQGIRAKLYLASLCALRFNPLMKAMYERLCLRGKAQNVCHWCADEETRALVLWRTEAPKTV